MSKKILGRGTASFLVDSSTGTIGASPSISSGVGTFTADVGVAIAYDFSVMNGPSSGTIDIDVSAPGTLSASTADCASHADIALPPGNESVVSGKGALANGTNNIVIAAPYSGGIADVSYTLNANSTGVYPGSCTSMADFLDPAVITGASVYDSNGNLVPGATLISDSGFNPNTTATPGPSSLLMLGTGLLGLIGTAKRKLLVSQSVFPAPNILAGGNTFGAGRDGRSVGRQ